MRLDHQFKLQAYLDGELSHGERRKVEALLASDREGQALLDELRATKTTLKGNEAPRPLPESREFYWSKIEREIQRLEAAPEVPAALPWLAWLKRTYWVPIGALGILILLALTASQVMDWSVFKASTRVAREGESPTDEMGAMTFRSEADRVTIIWLYERNPEIAMDTQ